MVGAPQEDVSELASVARRHTRYPVQVQVRLVCGNKIVDGITQDVSFSGLFVLHDDPPPLRSLVQVTLHPAGSGEISLLAMPVHILGRGNAWGRAAGIGLTLYGNGGDGAEAWRKFVQRLDQETTHAHALEHMQATAMRGQMPSGVATLPERSVEKIVELRFRSTEQLQDFVARELLADGVMCMPSSDTMRAGTRVVFNLTHPVSGKIFSIPAVVIVQQNGTGVEFLLEEDAALSLDAFVLGKVVRRCAG